MNIESIEFKYGFEYPEKFHKIYETGAMEWIVCGMEAFHRRKDEFIADPKAFLLGVGSCELIMFEEFEQQMEDLNELLEMNRKYGDVVMKPKYKAIPFGFNQGGDKYCFVYEEDKTEPFIVLLYHDEPNYEFYGKDFDEFLYLMMLDEVAYCLSELSDEKDYKHEAWLAHLEYLSEEYKTKLENAEFSKSEEPEEIIINSTYKQGPVIWAE